MSKQDMSHPVLWRPGLCSSHDKAPTTLCAGNQSSASALAKGPPSPTARSESLLPSTPRRDCVHQVKVLQLCTLGTALPTGDSPPALVTNPDSPKRTWAFCLLAAMRRKWYRGATGRLTLSRPAEGSSRADKVFSGLSWFRASLMRLTARTSGKEI